MNSRPQLFGTDGIRGEAGKHPLDQKTVFHLGIAIGRVLCRHTGHAHPQLLLGQDTRESSPWIAENLSAGLESAGVQVIPAGVLTTPAIAFLTRNRGFDAGIVVSASHNPYTDNGVKVLAASGLKLCEDYELEIERELGEVRSQGGYWEPKQKAKTHPSEYAEELRREYVQWLQRMAPQPLSNLRLVVDCANGAAAEIAPMALTSLGIRGRILHGSPNGRNINEGCGSVYPQKMAQTTAAERADLGVAFDGDADRAIFATRDGDILNGDYVLYMAALDSQRRGALSNNVVVGTVMSNLALELALAKHGITLKRAAVGDKFVLEEMLRSGAEIGGEPSGHVVFAKISLTGDGWITLLEILRLTLENKKAPEELAADLRLFPQVLRSVRVVEQPPLEDLREVTHAIEQCRRTIGSHGRIVVRYSGTEPVARVMVEARDERQAEFGAERIVAAIESSLGTGPEKNSSE